MDYTSPSLGYCFNPFEFCVEGDKLAEAELAAHALAEMLAEDYRVALVRLREELSGEVQRHGFPVLTVEMALDHHPLRRPMRLLDADLVIACSPVPTPMARVSVSADMDQTVAGVIACINDPVKSATLRRGAKRVSQWLEKQAARTPLYGLVLADEQGGPDAAGEAAALLEAVCDRVLLPEPVAAGGKAGGTTYGPGDLGAILSAQARHPGVAWLTLSTAHGKLDRAAITYLREHRNPFRYATVFATGPEQDPDPLCAIWEPKSHRRLLEALGCGVNSAAALLGGSPVGLLQRPAQAQ